MGWVSTPRPARFTSGKESVPIIQEARWVPRPVWTGAEKFRSHRDSMPRPLCRLTYPGSQMLYVLACLLFTYLLIPWRRVLLEKLTGSQLVQKFSAFYGTRRFITAFTRARHLSLSWASSIHSMSPHPTS